MARAGIKGGGPARVSEIDADIGCRFAVTKVVV